MLGIDGKQKTARHTSEADRDLEQETELHMSFLPKTLNSQNNTDLFTVLFAIPLSMIGTGLVFALLNAGVGSIAV